MDNTSNKNSHTRKNINDRMQNFFTPNSIQPKNMMSQQKNLDLDNEYYNYKPENTNPTQRNEVQQKTDFKTDINERLSMINDTTIQVEEGYHLIIIGIIKLTVEVKEMILMKD